MQFTSQVINFTKKYDAPVCYFKPALLKKELSGSGEMARLAPPGETTDGSIR